MIALIVTVIVLLLLVFLFWYLTKAKPTSEKTEEPVSEEPVSEETIAPAVVSPPVPVVPVVNVANPEIPPVFVPPVPTQEQKAQAIALSNRGTLKWYTSLVNGAPYMRNSADGTIIYLGEYTNAWDVMYAMVAAGCNGYTWFSGAPNNWNNLAYGVKGDPSEMTITPTMTAVSWIYGGTAV